MATLSNPFFGLPIGTLTGLQASYIDAIAALAANQSYSLNGRSLQRASLPDLTATLGNINAAIDLAANNTSAQTYVSFTGR